MTFDWMLSNQTLPNPRARNDAARKVVDDDIRERAELLARLGFDRKNATTRIERMLRWEHELGSTQLPVASRIQSIVKAAYQRTLGT